MQDKYIFHSQQLPQGALWHTLAKNIFYSQFSRLTSTTVKAKQKFE